ncbi:MAG: hypothetical protein ACYSU0_18805, partial [Planctomycetota bacterium]
MKRHSAARTMMAGTVALLLTYNCALVAGAAAAAEEAAFVEKGNARSVREVGGKWTRGEGCLACGGT